MTYLTRFTASFFLILTFTLLAGCGEEPIKIRSAAIINDDRGSGLFDRVLKICFDHPVSQTYFHKVKLITYDGVKIEGESLLRPSAHDPDNKCQLKNLYIYINRNSPPNAKDLIHDYVKPGNIKQLLIQVYYNKGDKKPVDEKLFRNL